MSTHIAAPHVTLLPLDQYTKATTRAIVSVPDELEELQGWHQHAYDLVFALLLHTGEDRDGGRGSAESVSAALNGCTRSLLTAMSTSTRREVAQQGSELLSLSHVERVARLAVVRSYIAAHLYWAEEGYRRVVIDQALAFARSMVPGTEGNDFWRDTAERAIAAMYSFSANGNPFHNRHTIATVTAHLLSTATSDTWSLLAKSDCQLACAVGEEMLKRRQEMRQGLQGVACHYLTLAAATTPGATTPTTN